MGTDGGYGGRGRKKMSAGLHRGSAQYPSVRSEGRKRHALSDRDRSPANAVARESRERQRAQGASGRRYSLLIASTRESREGGSLIHFNTSRRSRQWTCME